MKVIITAILVLLVTQAWAQPPSYDYLRRTVQDKNPNDKNPAAERIFVSYYYTNGVIVRWREGLTLRELIDATPHKGNAVQVRVLRSPDNKMNAAFDKALIKPTEKPTFAVKPQDVIYIEEPYSPDA